MKIDPIVAAYKITDTRSGTFYVGSTNNLDRRLREHRQRLTSRRHPNENLQRGFSDWNNVEVEYIATASEIQSKKIEQSLIDFHQGDPDCANIGTGSVLLWSGGMPEETREKIREANTGLVRSDESRRRISEAAKRRPPPSEATRQKLSAAGTGRPHSEEHKQRIAAAHCKKVTIDGVVYKSVQDAAKELKRGRLTIRNNIKSSDFPSWNFV